MSYIELQKEVTKDDSYMEGFEIKLLVTKAIDIPKNIFVATYYPKSRYTGPEKFVFSNVAYMDELNSIPDHVKDPRHTCEVRRPCATCGFTSSETAEEWERTVYADIQRLITQVDTLGYSGTNYSKVVVTKDSVSTSPVEEPIKEPKTTVATPKPKKTVTPTVTEKVKLSFEG